MGLGLNQVIRGLEPALIWPSISVGLVYGWGLVRLAKRTWTAYLLSILSGVLFSSVVMGRLWDEILVFIQRMVFWGLTVYDAVVSAFYGELVLPSFGTFFLELWKFCNSFFIMMQRLVLWIWRYPRMSNDMIANLMAWGLILWLVTTWLAWMLWRHNRPLEAVLPAFMVVAIARTSVDASPNVVLVMLGLAIALMILSAQENREEEWLKRGLGYSEIIRKHTTQSAVVLSLLLVVSSAGITSIDLEELQERWEDFTTREERGSVSVGDGSGSVRVIPQDDERVTLAMQFVELSKGGLPTNHLVGSGPELSDEVVMIVKLEEFDPITEDLIEVADPVNQSYYLRSLNYDKYTSQGWYATIGQIFSYLEGQEAIRVYTSRQRMIRQEVRYDRMVSGLHRVHVVGDLAVVDRKYSASWREGRGLSLFKDMFGATVESRSYEAYSVTPAYTEEALREVLPEYPIWLAQRYLSLPDMVPDRVIDLAYELTENEISTYDKAVAIEQYLRTYTYDLDLPIRPNNIDTADYFLFELQRGYCDYYASTMVVLARAAGIPARLAVGYLVSTYDEENEYYVVTADQAHSWVEVYFEGYGWVTFEPTAGRPAVDREKVAPQVSEYFERNIIFEEQGIEYSGLEIMLFVISGVLGLGVIGFLVWLRLEIFLLRRQRIEAAFARMYRQLLLLGRLLKIEQGVAQTPLEFSAKMRDQLEIMRLKHARLFTYLEKTPRRVQNLVVLANKAAYHSEPPDVFDRAQAVDHWVVIRRHIGAVLFWDWLTGLWPKVSISKESELEQA